MRDTKTGETRVVLDPNTWGETETLAGFNPSPDGKFIAFGKANAGDENPVIRVMNTETGEILPDTLRGWKQRGASWHHDNSGFYYSANPLPGEVAAGEEFYWNRVYFHKLGTPAEQDELVLDDPEVKEHFHFAGVSEDGRWLMMYRYAFNAQSIWIKDLTRKNAKPVALTTDMQNEYLATMVEDRIFIRTNHDAPNYRVMTTTTDKPGREHWREMIPEASDKLSSISGIAGHLYLTYQHNATTKIEVRDIDGEKLHDMELPTVGTAGVSGYWSKPEVWVGFSSFAHPSTTYQYSAKDRELTLYKESPIKIDVSDIVVDQVWYPSKDGTEVSMFIVRHKDAPKDGSTPFLLTGYGGFNVSMTPRFSTGYAVWVESGGGVAIPNLRGGGEYGQAWHEAGMRDQKQNVFDDFIAAAEYLVDKGYTASERLAISGGSNGGLLVSAAVTQRPELFEAVLCQVPLTDMVRYHHFGLANIWSEEYGNADDPEMFPHILEYSPYHAVEEGTDYPAILVTGSLNDARTDPVHARKFAAAVRWADADKGQKQPILLHLQGDSGHGGGVTIDTRADQTARHYGFLMSQIQMPAAKLENRKG